MQVFPIDAMLNRARAIVLGVLGLLLGFLDLLGQGLQSNVYNPSVATMAMR
jgi:hypothetical protein